MKTQLVSEQIQARALLGFADLVQRHDANPQQLLTETGIPSEALSNPDLPIPLDQLATLYHHAAEALALPDFGLRLAALQDASLYGPLAHLALNAATVGDALHGISRYFAYHTPGAEIETGPAADPAYLQVQYRLRLSDQVPPRQIIEQSYAMAAKLWRMVEPAGGAPIRIHLRHPAALNKATYQRAYQCPVLFEQPHDAIWLPQAALTVPIDHADSRLRDAAEHYVASILKRFPLDLGKQVETLITQQLPFGGATLDHIAEQLRLHKRTLQRRLAEHGIVFADLLDEVRKGMAQQLLHEPTVPLARVSGLLGYNEQSSFIRACKRWFGVVPGEVRRDA